MDNRMKNLIPLTDMWASALLVSHGYHIIDVKREEDFRGRNQVTFFFKSCPEINQHLKDIETSDTFRLKAAMAQLKGIIYNRVNSSQL
jgi:hypothetical protein